MGLVAQDFDTLAVEEGVTGSHSQGGSWGAFFEWGTSFESAAPDNIDGRRKAAAVASSIACPMKESRTIQTNLTDPTFPLLR